MESTEPFTFSRRLRRLLLRRRLRRLRRRRRRRLLRRRRRLLPRRRRRLRRRLPILMKIMIGFYYIIPMEFRYFSATFCKKGEGRFKFFRGRVEKSEGVFFGRRRFSKREKLLK